MRKTVNAGPSLLRRLLGFLLVLIAAGLMCLSIVTLSVSKTLLNEEFMTSQLKDKGVYGDTAEAVRSSFRGLYRNSDYRNDSLDRIVDKHLGSFLDESFLEEILRPIIHQAYEGKVPKFSAEAFSEKYSDAAYDRVRESSGDADRNGINQIVSDVGRALSRHIQLKDLGRLVKKLGGWITGPSSLIAILCIAGVVLLLVLVILLVRQVLKLLRLHFLISGILMILIALACWIFLPKDLVLINESITAVFNSIQRWLVMLFFLTCLQNLLISLLLGLILRSRKKRAARKAVQMAG